jgi:hypothetical protein
MVLAGNMAELDTLDPASRELAITQMLDQARSWLAHAREASVPARDIADFKAFVASAADAARRVGVSKEIQLDAIELQRRAERALGLAIRAGQEAGEIRSQGQSSTQSDYTRTRNGVEEFIQPHLRDTKMRLISPRELLGTNGNTHAEIYALTDDVTDADFEAALADARTEKNLSRLSIIRHVRAEHGTREAEPDSPATLGEPARIDRLREMAAAGYTSRQIGAALGINQDAVAYRIKKYSIKVPADRVVGVTRRHDSNRIVRESIATLEGVVLGLELVNPDALDGPSLEDWAGSLTASIRALNRFNRQMKERLQ